MYVQYILYVSTDAKDTKDICAYFSPLFLIMIIHDLLFVSSVWLQFSLLPHLLFWWPQQNVAAVRAKTVASFFFGGYVVCWLQCASYLKWLLKHNYSKLTKVDHNDSIIWTSLVVSRLWCVQPFLILGNYIRCMQIRCESSWAKLKGCCVWFTYFQVCTGPSQTWILHSISSWKNKDSNQIFVFQP